MFRETQLFLNERDLANPSGCVVPLLAIISLLTGTDCVLGSTVNYSEAAFWQVWDVPIRVVEVPLSAVLAGCIGDAIGEVGFWFTRSAHGWMRPLT